MSTYLAMMTSPCGDYEARGKGGLRSQSAARRWIADQFAADPELSEGAIYLDVPEHAECGDEMGCDGHLVAEVRRDGDGT